MKPDKPLSLDFDESASALAFQLTDSLDSVSMGGDKQVVELKKELQSKNKLLEAKSQELSELKFKNRQLEQANRDIQSRQRLLDDELSKAEAQIEFIQEFMNEVLLGEASEKGIKSE